MQTEPLWTDALLESQRAIPAELPVKADVAVVGAGLTGLSAALTFLRQGATVAVLERGPIGAGASSRSLGIMTTGLRLPIEVIFKRYGEAVGHIFWQASISAIDLVGELVADEELDCGFERRGHVLLAARPRHFRRMQKQVDWYRYKLGHRLTLVEAAEMRSEIGSGIYYGGVVDELSGSVDPARLIAGLAELVRIHGAALCEQTAVTKITPNTNGYYLATEQGILSADTVVVATNGYRDGLVPALKRRVAPGRMSVIATEPLPVDLELPLNPRGRVFIDSHSRPNLFRQTQDGRLLWGGMPGWHGRGSMEEDVAWLEGQMHHAFPDLAEFEVTHAWSGQVGQTLDWLPHIGEVGGIHYAAGYNGHGIALAVYLGRELARQVGGLGRDSIFSELRHVGLLGGPAWLLKLTEWYHRAWGLVVRSRFF